MGAERGFGVLSGRPGVKDAVGSCGNLKGPIKKRKECLTHAVPYDSCADYDCC